MPLAPATEDAPTVDAAHGPEPEPLPAPDTVPPRRSGSTALTIAAAAFTLLVAVAAWLSVGVPGPIVPTGFTPGVEAALSSRAATEYPAFTVEDAWTYSHPDTVTADVLTDVQLKMLSKEHPGFQFTLVYTAPSKYAGDASYFRTEERFFSAGATPTQPTDSFMDMWLHERPGETCFGVIDTTYYGSTEDTRTYYVVATRYEQNGVSLTSVQETYRYAYRSSANTWTQLSADDGPAPSVPATSAAAPEPDAGAVASDCSLPDTRTAVAEALPGFEFVRLGTDALDNETLIVRHLEYPKLRLAVYAYQLDLTDPDDGFMKIWTGDRTKADAFAKAFSARYPGSVIVDVTFDPQGTSNDDLVDVHFTPEGGTVRFRYDPKRHVWSKVK